MESSTAPLSEFNPGSVAKDNGSKNPMNQSHHTLNDISTEDDFTRQTSTYPSSALLVLYFHAPWAEPCKQMSTILSTLASTYQVSDPPKIAFFSIDAEEVSEISEKYDVTQVPYIVLEKGGEVVETISGGDVARVRTTIEKHAGPADTNPGSIGLPPMQQVSKPLGTESLDGDHKQANGDTGSGGAKNLAGYAPDSSDPNTAPDYSSGDANPKAKEELQQRLSELVKAAPVMLFMKGTPSAPQCGFSRQTVSILRDKGVRYGFFNILADDEVRQGLKEFSDWPTFPQVYVGGELIGGLDILKEEFENDPEFLKDYAASSQSRMTGGPSA